MKLYNLICVFYVDKVIMVTIWKNLSEQCRMHHKTKCLRLHGTKIDVQDRECIFLRSYNNIASGVPQCWSLEVKCVPGRSEATAGRWNPRLTVGRWLCSMIREGELIVFAWDWSIRSFVSLLKTIERRVNKTQWCVGTQREAGSPDSIDWVNKGYRA